MTLSRVAGRRQDYTVLVWISVTDVTENSRRLVAATSTTCSTLVTAVFESPIDIQQALVQHTQSVSVPIRRPSDKNSVSHKLRDRHIVRIYIVNTTTCQVHISYAVYSRVWRLCVVFLEHGGGALGIFKSPVCTYNQAWTFLYPLHTVFPSSASAAGGVGRPLSEAPCIYM